MEKKKVLILGIDGLDPRLTKTYMEAGIMPNTKKFLERGAAQVDYEMIGGQPTVLSTLKKVSVDASPF